MNGHIDTCMNTYVYEYLYEYLYVYKYLPAESLVTGPKGRERPDTDDNPPTCNIAQGINILHNCTIDCSIA